MTQESLYLEDIIKPIVSKPESVKIKQTTDERGILLTLTVHKEDTGLIIGKQGETARAIRRLIRLFGVINNQRLSIRITDHTKT